MEIGRPVYSDELLHYQVKGAKWGVRRWQYPDGSLTPEGRIHYGIGPARDTDPDLVDPVTKAKADVEAVGTAKYWRDQYRDIVKKNEKELRRGRRWLSFESKKDWAERKQKLEKNLESDREHAERFSVEFMHKREEAQKRYDKYQTFCDSLMDDIDYIDFGVFEETGEVPEGKHIYEDRDAMEAIWNEIEDATEEYYYTGLFDDQRARVMSSINRSSEKLDAETKHIADEATRNVKLPKNTKAFADKLRTTLEMSWAKGSGGLNSIKELNDVDNTEIVKAYKDYEQDKAWRIADFAARKMLGNSANDIVDRKDVSGKLYGESLTTARDVARTYILERSAADAFPNNDPEYIYLDGVEYQRQKEKAIADSTDDPEELERMWKSFEYYDVTDKLNRARKKKKS